MCCGSWPGRSKISPMEICRMEFSGKLLKRGFWLYVWDIREDRRHHIYVGRTGDSSSPNASSPFRRIGQHLDLRVNAKGNALLRQLRKAQVNPEFCTFEMTAIGPIFEEQETMLEHKPLRDKTAALESALAQELRRRGYNVLGSHPRPAQVDPSLLDQLLLQVSSAFPERHTADAPQPRFQPIRLRGDGPTASEILIQERRDSRF